MSWDRLLAAGRIARHRTSAAELDALRGAIALNLGDAALPGLSADNRYGLAYEAVLLAAKLAVAAAGFRVKAVPGAHRATFEALALALGPSSEPPVSYFELARRRRNEFSYEAAGIVTDREAGEMTREAKRLPQLIEGWLQRGTAGRWTPEAHGEHPTGVDAPEEPGAGTSLRAKPTPRLS